MAVAVLCSAHFVVVEVGELEVGSGVVEGSVDEFDVHPVVRHRQNLGSKGVLSCWEEVSDQKVRIFTRRESCLFVLCVACLESNLCLGTNVGGR